MDTLSVGDPIFDLVGLCVTYLLYNESDPDNAREFLGISVEMAHYVWKKTIELYFEGKNGDDVKKAENSIKLIAYVRFLYLVTILGITKPELKQPRIDRALEQLRILIDRVESLEVSMN